MNRTGGGKSVIIVGSGQLGASFAKKLSDLRYDVTTVDNDAESFYHIHEDYGGYALVGDGGDVDVLERAGIRDAYMVCALTGYDNINIFIAEVASRIYDVPCVYARLSDSNKAGLLEGFNIEVLCPRLLCEQEFIKLSGIALSGVD